MIESPERSSQSDSEEPATRPPHAKQDLGTAETAVDLANLRDELGVLARSSPLGTILGWTIVGVLLLLLAALVNGGAPLFVSALFPFLAAARKGPSYLRNRAARRELKGRLESLQLG